MALTWRRSCVVTRDTRCVHCLIKLFNTNSQHLSATCGDAKRYCLGNASSPVGRLLYRPKLGPAAKRPSPETSPDCRASAAQRSQWSPCFSWRAWVVCFPSGGGCHLGSVTTSKLYNVLHLVVVIRRPQADRQCWLYRDVDDACFSIRAALSPTNPQVLVKCALVRPEDQFDAAALAALAVVHSNKSANFLTVGPWMIHFRSLPLFFFFCVFSPFTHSSLDSPKGLGPSSLSSLGIISLM